MNDLIKNAIKALEPNKTSNIFTEAGMFNQEEPVTEDIDDIGDLVEEWISEEDYYNLSEEEQQNYIHEDRLDELMGKSSLEKIKDTHQQASADIKKSNDRSRFHDTQAARAHSLISKRDTRATYGKEAQHYHQYGYDSKRAKNTYAKLSDAGKKKVDTALGAKYSGKDKAPHIDTKGKTTIHNPSTKAQNYDHAVKRTNTVKSMGLPTNPKDEKTIKAGRD